MTLQDQKPAKAQARVRCHDCVVHVTGFCGAVSCRHLHALDRISMYLDYDRGQALVTEGEAAACVFNVVEGVVRLTKLLADGRRAVVGFLFPGRFLGLSALSVHTYSAEAVTPVRACRFSRPKLEALCAERPELEHRLREMVSHELMAAQNRMLTLGRKSLDERMASFLLELAGQGQSADTGADLDLIPVPMTRTDIADYLGLTIETVSRCLSAMSRRGLIDLPNRRSVRVKDWATLRRLAEGVTG